MFAPEHPAPAVLIRFAHSESTSEETRAVVRHLVAGCPRCSAVVRSVWQKTERLALRRRPKPQLARRVSAER